MTRSELIAVVADYAGPVTPFRTDEDQTRSFEEALAHATEEDLRALLGLLERPPPAAAQDGWHDALEQALVLVGAQHRDAATTALTALLHRDPPVHRETAIAALGELGGPEQVSALAAVSEDGLSHAELVALACALGDLGGPHARARLQRMMRSFAHLEAVKAEIDISLSRIE